MDNKIQVTGRVDEVLFTVRGNSVGEVAALYEQLYDQALVWAGKQSEFEAARRRQPEKAEEAPASLSQKAIERDARRRVARKEAKGNGQVVCPEHGKALMGRWGLYCPSKLGDGSWCKWRPGKKEAA